MYHSTEAASIINRSPAKVFAAVYELRHFAGTGGWARCGVVERPISSLWSDIFNIRTGQPKNGGLPTLEMPVWVHLNRLPFGIILLV